MKKIFFLYINIIIVFSIKNINHNLIILMKKNFRKKCLVYI